MRIIRPSRIARLLERRLQSRCLVSSRQRPYGSDRRQSRFDFQRLFEAVPGRYLVLLPDAPQFTIVAVRDAYGHATLTRRDQIVGRGFFEVFPDNTFDPTAAGTRLRESLERVLTRRLPDPETVEQYDGRESAEFAGQVDGRWWRSKNVPVI